MEGVAWSDFASLFRWALAAALLAGVVLPLVGCFLFVRRTSFEGIALPQIALAGVAASFAALPWCCRVLGWPHADPQAALTDVHGLHNYGLVWAGMFTLAGLGLLLATGRRGENEIGRVAAAFALATAAIYLLASWTPFGRGEIEELLHGELSFVGEHEFHTLAAVLLATLALLLLFRRDLVLVSFDRELARVLGKPVLAFEGLLLLLIGMSVAVGTLILGPTLLFGLLVLPPLAARPFARSMQSFLLLAAGLGLLQVVLGTAAGYWADLPLGPAMVGSGALLCAAGLLKRH